MSKDFFLSLRRSSCLAAMKDSFSSAEMETMWRKRGAFGQFPLQRTYGLYVHTFPILCETCSENVPELIFTQMLDALKTVISLARPAVTKKTCEK